MTEAASPPTVLLVEDNPGDVRLVREAFTELDVDVSLRVATNCLDALDSIRSGDPPPQLVLLDINLPDGDGCSVLTEIKEAEQLRRTPVIILTTSDQTEDITRMYDNHANAYVTKPDTVSEYLATIDHLVSFWLSTATLPATSP